jgi:type II secretory pathway component GspD/PulD (secretin)
MRPIQLAVLMLSGLCCGLLIAQQPVGPQSPPAKIDYSILAQPAQATRVGLSDEQRASIARILETRVGDLIAAEPADRQRIVDETNSQIEALLTAEQKQALAASLSGGNLQFSFYKQKWSEVLVWFAQQADLSLVMDREPPGLFTYNDTREFSPAEAIDLLNSVLISKNFTLLRRGRMLVVVDTTDGIPYDLVQQVPLDKLSEYGRFEILTVEFALEGRPIETVVDAVKPLVGNHGQVIPLAAAGKLLVTETAGRLQAISAVVASVPVPKQDPAKKPEPPPAPVLATYPADGLDPKTTTDVLKALFPAATINFDPNAAVIHCQAPPDTQTAIEATLAKLIQSVSGDNKPRLRTYPVPAKRLSALVDQLALAHPKLAIDADVEKSRLLVVANASEHAELLKTLESLGTSAEANAGGSQSVMLYPVDPSSVAAATALLQEVIPAALVISDQGRIAVRGTAQEHELARTTIDAFAQRSDTEPQLGFYPLDQPLSREVLAVLTAAIPRATITWLTEEQKLSVLATPAEQRRFAELLGKIQQDQPPAVTEPQQLDVTVDDANELLTLLQQRFPTIEMVFNEKTRSLQVWADPPDFERIKIAFAKFSAALPPREESVMIPYPLANADAATVLTLLTSMRPEMNAAVDTNANRILVSAPLSEHPRYKTLIEELDSEPHAPRAPIVESYPVTAIAPTTAVSVLTALFPKLSLTADATNRRIVASGEAFEHARFKAALEKVDVPEADRDTRLETYQLNGANPTQILSVLTQLAPTAIAAASADGTQLFAWGDDRAHRIIAQAMEHLTQADNKTMRAYPLPRGAGPTALTAMQQVAVGAKMSLDAKYENLIVLANDQEHEAIAAAVENLRQDLGSAAENTTHVYHFEKGTPTAAYTVLRQLLPNATLAVDAATSVLVATATSDEHAQIDAVVKQIETEPASNRTLKAYPLPRGAGPTALTYMRPVATDATLSLDAKYENLIAFATAEEHVAIAAAVENLRQDLGSAAENTTHVYHFEKGTPAAAYTVLRQLLPNATLAVDAATSVLVATATSDEHAQIDAVVKQIETEPASNRTLKAYPLPRGAGPTALTYMRPVATDATLSLDAKYENLIAFATVEEHVAIAAAVENLRQDLVNPAGDEQVVAVYPLDPELITAASLVASFDDATIDGLSILPNVETNSLIVRGSAEAQAKFGQTIDAITGQLKKTNELQTQVYRFSKATPAVAVEALTALMPDAEFGVDEETSVLIATATARQQQTIATVVQQIDTEQFDGNRSTRVYRLNRASARNIYRALRSLTPKANIGYDDDSNVVIATATDDEHQILQEATAQVEGRSQRGTIKIYPLANVEAVVAASTIQAMSNGQASPVDVQPNEDTNSLLVVADETQHESIRQAIEQLDADDRQFEVFPLTVNDPYLVESSINDLFGDLPDSATPALSTDYETSKLFVRGTTKQVDQIRELLRKLGETLPGDEIPLGTGRVRTIRFGGDTAAAIEQLQTIWPRLRNNPIQVITPAGAGLKPRVPSDNAPSDNRASDNAPSDNRASDNAPSDNRASDNEPSDNGANADESGSPPDDSGAKRQRFQSHPPSPALLAGQTAANDQRLVVFQNTTRAPEPDPPTTAPDAPAVTISTSGDSITIASDDTAALDRMESLLRAMAGRGNQAGESSNFAIFLLRNTGATDVESLLKKLVKDLRFQRTGLTTAAFVADERLNALVVHGNQQARDMIGQLLEVLDTQDLADPLNVYRSEIISLQHAQASRVLAILENVYKTQLRAGGGRRPISIPEGIDPTVASMLQQINAVTSGPVLTLDIDESTNSLIMRAPPELRAEISEFVATLDQQSKQNSNRRVRVIRLRESKSDQIQAALEQFISDK